MQELLHNIAFITIVISLCSLASTDYFIMEMRIKSICMREVVEKLKAIRASDLSPEEKHPIYLEALQRLYGEDLQELHGFMDKMEKTIKAVDNTSLKA